MVFDKPSTRTRVSFDVGMRELGGETIMLTGQEMQLGRGETIADTARVLSRYVDAIMIRMLDHEMVVELARHATVPVINGLTKLTHPCQIMADVMTFEEHRGPIAGRTVAWTGDSNNVLASWVHAAARLDFKLEDRDAAGTRAPSRAFVMGEGRGSRHHGDDRSLRGRGQGRRGRHRLLGLDGRRGRGPPPQPPEALSGERPADGVAAKDAIFMHCLPAHRGEEVTDEVMDGPQSVVFDEAENRLHAQKGILAWCLGAVAA